ncbi:MAG: sugar phosphate isomerase/epimerase [Clostridiales bacterium]|uniref:AP endonuclease n=1 Tax=Flavonifractor porci TaxID=3133422 RepID=UPI0030ADB9F3|nr:sugar phosphate isomerase/epimerase [Clostridiales bacterium]
MIQSISLPLHSGTLREYQDWSDLRREVYTLGCGGIEAIWGGEPIPEDLPLDLVQGYHLIFFHDWVDLWNGNWLALKEKYGSLERAAAVYGGLDRETLLEQYREDLERARRLKVGYVVFHVSDVSMEECFTYRFSHTGDQVITAAMELINELLSGNAWPFEFLVENQWWPGFTFTEPRQTERLLDGIRFDRKGILLDTGHLMNCCTDLRSQAEGAAYIAAMLDRHGSLCSAIRGVHFHQSLSGRYVQRNVGQLPEAWPEAFERRFSINYAHVLRIDQHRPWTDPSILPVLERIDPVWLTHELTSRTRAERVRTVECQQTLLRKRVSSP